MQRDGRGSLRIAGLLGALIILSAVPAARAEDRSLVEAVVYDAVQCVKFLHCEFTRTLDCITSLDCYDFAVCNNLPGWPPVTVCEG